MIFTTHKNVNIQIDGEDFERVSLHKWHLTKSGHIYTSIRSECIFIHNFILSRDTDPRLVVDHINQDPSDNRKENLRVVTKSINAMNKYSKWGKSKFKGVSRAKGVADNYRAYVTYNKKRYSLGVYTSEIEAARAYNFFVLKVIPHTMALNPTGDDYSLFIPIPRNSQLFNSVSTM